VSQKDIKRRAKDSTDCSLKEKASHPSPSRKIVKKDYPNIKDQLRPGNHRSGTRNTSPLRCRRGDERPGRPPYAEVACRLFKEKSTRHRSNERKRELEE